MPIVKSRHTDGDGLLRIERSRYPYRNSFLPIAIGCYRYGDLLPLMWESRHRNGNWFLPMERSDHDSGDGFPRLVESHLPKQDTVSLNGTTVVGMLAHVDLVLLFFHRKKLKVNR